MSEQVATLRELTVQSVPGAVELRWCRRCRAVAVVCAAVGL